MTEVYYPNSDTNSADRWPEALDVSQHIHNAMVEGDFQAYVWWYIRRSYGPMKEDGTISKRGYNMAHFSKFVRPGYVRIDATKNLMRTFTCQPIKVTTRSLLLPSIKATQESTKTLFCRMDLLQTYLDGSRAAAAIYNLERISLYQAIIFGLIFQLKA